jgi:hypothetical protein
MRLTARQIEMLRLLIIAGRCEHIVPARYASAWIVRARTNGDVARTFSEPTGNALLRRGLIETESSHTHGPLTSTSYRPTQAGIDRAK